MRVRRCSIVYLEAREDVAFDLNLLMAGGDGLRRDLRWLALAPHRGVEVEIDADQQRLLGALSPSGWVDEVELEAHPRAAIEGLLQEGLLIADDEAHVGWRARDEALRDAHWHPLAATLHAFTRWEGVDAVQNMRDSHTEYADQMRDLLGPPPPESARAGDGQTAIALPRGTPDDFDALLARRATCRNFDPSRPLPLPMFAHMLERVFAAQACVRITDDTAFLKKNVPSGGGLHPLEAYLFVQHVEGIAPGLYHYQAQDHTLEPLPMPARPINALMLDAVAQQHWFSDAHVMVLLVARFDRTFWKYRQHAKGYRVVAMEAGHVSQTLYLAATQAGLAAFITAAINERMLETVLGLDHTRQGAMAMCGFGWRSAERVNAELDPNGKVWPI